jgi:RND family efflux transporter MFP subunit
MLRRDLLPVLVLCGVAAGCNSLVAQQEQKQPPPPDVVVAPAVEEVVTDFEEFYGKTQGEREVDLRARVSGYLDKMLFKDGAEVHEGDILFEIDPRPLQAELDRNDALLATAEAHLQRLEYDYGRAQRLIPTKGMSREEYDKAAGDLAEARSALKAARAGRKMARLNLDYSSVTAPISGRISRRFVDPGNMVKADETILTRIVTLDPMYAYFDIDERTYLRIQRFLEHQESSPGLRKSVAVALGLCNSEVFDFPGTIDFVDNRVDPDSGSVWVRGTFPNPKRELTPGLFGRIRVPTSTPHRAVLIPEKAVATDQGEKFVWVLDDTSYEGVEHARYLKVKLGSQHELPGKDESKRPIFREVLGGIKAGQRVIVSGQQKVRNRPGTDANGKRYSYAEVHARLEGDNHADDKGGGR